MAETFPFSALLPGKSPKASTAKYGIPLRGAGLAIRDKKVYHRKDAYKRSRSSSSPERRA